MFSCVSLTVGEPSTWLRPCGLALALAISSCTSGPTPSKYPDVKVNTPAFELNIEDDRKRFYETITEQSERYERGSETYAQELPEGFEMAAIGRLKKLSAGSGLTLKLLTRVERADATFINEPRGKFVRYDVTLAFRITTESGALLEKGRGSAWQELPEREMTEPNMLQVFEQTALEAFDRYFASESTLKKLNEQIAAYKKTHPEAS